MANNPPNGFTGFGGVRRIQSQPAQAGVGISLYGSERLTDFMRDRGAQLSKYGNPINVSQFCLSPLQRFFRTLAIGYIDEVKIRPLGDICPNL